MLFNSLFIWSNETLNIWTHLLGFMYFMYLLVFDNLSLMEDPHGDFGDNLTFTLMDIAYMVCERKRGIYFIFFTCSLSFFVLLSLCFSSLLLSLTLSFSLSFSSFSLNRLACFVLPVIISLTVYLNQPVRYGWGWI